MRQNTKITRLRSLILALIILISSISVPQNSYAQPTGKDVASILKPSLKVTLYQAGKKLEDNSSVEGKSPIAVNVEFKVPVKNDKPKPAQVVEKNDYTKIEIGKGIIVKDSNFKDITYTNKDTGKKIKLGVYRFVTDPATKKVTLEVEFTGDNTEDVFNDYEDITAKFDADFNLDISDIPPNQGGNKTVTILDKTYSFTVKEPDDKITVTKKGKVIVDDPDNRSIEWTVEVGTDGEVLDGYTLSDDLTNVGEYINGSFEFEYGPEKEKVNASNIASEVQYNTSKQLQYTFKKINGESIKKPVTVKFRTKLTDEEFMAIDSNSKSKSTTKTNEVKILKGAEEKAKATTKVNWSPKWATKSHYKHGKEGYQKKDGNYYIDWEIVVNEEKAKLKNVKIKDILGATTDTLGRDASSFSLEIVEAELKFYKADGTEDTSKSQKYGPGNSPIPAGNIFEVGNIDGKVELKVTTKLNNFTDSDLNRRYTFKNSAEVTWDSNNNTPVKVSNYVYIGTQAINKDVKDKTYFINDQNREGSEQYFLNQEAEWTITVSKDNIDNNPVVYDMIIFDPEVPSGNVKDLKILDSANNYVDEIDGIKLKKLEPQHLNYHKYIGSSEINNGLTLDVKPLYYKKDGTNFVHVGDLIIVKGFTQDKREFKLKTRLTDPKALIHDKDKDLDKEKGRPFTNTAYLAKGNQLVDRMSCWTRYLSRMLEKQALSVADAQKFKNIPTADNANKGINKIDPENKEKIKYFNYNTKSVIYRLSVNANQIKEVGDIDVTDTLPKGWVLKSYTIFEGEPVKDPVTNPNVIDHSKTMFEQIKQLDSTVKATGNGVSKILIGTEINTSINPTHSINNKNIYVNYTAPTSSIDSGEVKFKFKDIDKAYAILLEAGPTDEVFKTYLESQEEDVVDNKVKLNLASNTNRTLEKTQKINIDKNVLFKNYDSGVQHEDGYLKWNIDYTPFKLVKPIPLTTDVVLKDELGEGMALRFNDDGTLKLTESDGTKNFKIFELNMAADGSLTEGNEVNDISNNISYTPYDSNDSNSPKGGTLNFKIPNIQKSYRFFYITDLTGEVNSKVSNTVKLEQSNLNSSYTPGKEYIITNQDASANMTRSSRIEITKMDESGNPLREVYFKLKNKQGTKTYEDIQKSDLNGKVVFNAIPEGDYELRETKTLDGYILDDKTYTVNVVRIHGQLKASISEMTENDKSKITITNYKVPVEIQKVDKYDNNKILQNAKFILKDRSGKLIRDNIVTDQDGKAKFYIPKVGDYILEEKTPPAGYELRTQPIRISVEKKDSNDGFKVLIDNVEQTEAYKIENTLSETTTAMLKVNKYIKNSLQSDSNDKEFEFEVHFYKLSSDNINYENDDREYDYSIEQGRFEGNKIKSGSKFYLKANGSLTIKDIPNNTKYKIEESENVGYRKEEESTEGLITAGTTQTQLYVASFTNIRTGKLKIEKKVTGNDGDINKDFEFTVKIDNNNISSYSYTGSKSGTIVNGGTITLKDGEYIIIDGIDIDDYYTITETDSSATGYTTTVNGKVKDTRDIIGRMEKEEEDVVFVNTRNKVNPGGGGSGGDNPPPRTPKEDPKTPPTTPKEDPKTPPTTPKEDPKTPPTTPKEDPKTPPTTPKEDPKTPPPTPDTPPDTPPAPSVPSYPRNNPPDPNDPNSPETIVVVDENGVP
ncbi:hypothetical protein HMPREF9630_02109, partial [Peptoanaerobacter stomatis]